MPTSWQVAAVYIGAVIGAGFISGQEAVQFFVRFDRAGIWGALGAGMCFAYFGSVVIERAVLWRAQSHQDLLLRLCGRHIGNLIDWALGPLLLSSISVMLAGGGALVHQSWGLPPFVGVLAMAGITALIVINDPKRILRLNGILVIVMLSVVVSGSLLSLTQAPVPDRTWVRPRQGFVPGSWWISALLYVAYNLVLIVSPLSAFSQAVAEPADGRRGGFLGGTVLGMLLLLMITAIFAWRAQVGAAEIPMLAMLAVAVPGLAPIYRLTIWLALLTTAVASSSGLVKRLEASWSWNRPWALGAILVAALPFGLAGLSNLVRILYPIIGYLGMVLLICLVISRRP